MQIEKKNIYLYILNKFFPFCFNVAQVKVTRREKGSLWQVHTYIPLQHFIFVLQQPKLLGKRFWSLRRLPLLYIFSIPGWSVVTGWPKSRGNLLASEECVSLYLYLYLYLYLPQDRALLDHQPSARGSNLSRPQGLRGLYLQCRAFEVTIK